MFTGSKIGLRDDLTSEDGCLGDLVVEVFGPGPDMACFGGINFRAV